MLVYSGKDDRQWIAQKVVQPAAEVEAKYGLETYPWPFGSPYHTLSFYPEQPPLQPPDSLESTVDGILKRLVTDPFSRSLNAVEEGE